MKSGKGLCGATGFLLKRQFQDPVSLQIASELEGHVVVKAQSMSVAGARGGISVVKSLRSKEAAVDLGMNINALPSGKSWERLSKQRMSTIWA